MKILIDNGHGQSTPGKRSPDGRFLEFKFNREIAQRIVADLRDRGYDAELLVEEYDDVPLAERYRRANTYSQALGKENVILVSIHANAFGNGREWTKARGWSVYTGKGQTRADLLADDLARVTMKDLGSKAVCGVCRTAISTIWTDNLRRCLPSKVLNIGVCIFKFKKNIENILFCLILNILCLYLQRKPNQA